MKPRLVPQSTPLPPPLRIVTEADAMRHYPRSAAMRTKWLDSVAWLRVFGSQGWLLDRPLVRRRDQRGEVDERR